ncbi:DNA primase [Pontibacter sp. G13]|uniref:DNA primase n=1 Tax=Pontibacter sp. G13 TaxID=3074898 RepID=UPI00288AB6F3|nr:DNA primase [Pontibacter sp. G13]WNJ16411.1 DNA primase [Pontibacter sp. G13]
MGRIPPQIVDQIYNALDILEIVQDYLPLKKRGANHWANSPWTNEKTPSFAVNPVKGIYKDFSSGKGGNAINFLMEMEGYTYVEALKHVARKYNIEIEEEEETAEAKEARDKRQSLGIVNEWTARWFQTQLTETPEGKTIGLSYFKERGILDSTIETFQLGYSPDAWETYAQAAVAAQFKPEYLVELGLVSKSEKTGKLLDRFRGRVMFPISNAVGKVVGFGGRILGNRKDVGKYINSPESEVYHKSEVLYGLHLSKKAIRDQDLCILTEGYMDVILLHQYGIQNVVASSGTALTPEQIRLIRRFTKNVLMIYDGDAAGIKAAKRGIDLLIKAEMNAKVLVLPDKHDPDSYVRLVGAKGFQDTIEQQALSFIDFKLQVLRNEQDPNDPAGQTAIIKSLAETLAYIPDMVSRQMYVRKVAQQVDITEALMTHAVDEARREHAKIEARERKRREARSQQQPQHFEPGQMMMPPPMDPMEVPVDTPVRELRGFEQLELAAQERELLRILVNHAEEEVPEIPEGGALEDENGEAIEYPKFPLVDYFMDELEGFTFENGTFETLKNRIFEEFDQTGKVDISRYLTDQMDDIRRIVSELLINPHEISPNWKKINAFVTDFDDDLAAVMKGAISHYKFRRVDRLIVECQEKIQKAEDEDDMENLDKFMDTFIYLSKLRKDIHGKIGIDGAIRGNDAHL